MLREWQIFGIFFPTLLLLFILAALACWVLDGILARMGFYHLVWHASLFRICLFVCVFSALGLTIYA